ncbi:MAG: hypothetical protein ACRCVT_01775 [Leadbetterella sp.]
MKSNSIIANSLFLLLWAFTISVRAQSIQAYTSFTFNRISDGDISGKGIQVGIRKQKTKYVSFGIGLERFTVSKQYQIVDLGTEEVIPYLRVGAQFSGVNVSANLDKKVYKFLGLGLEFDVSGYYTEYYNPQARGVYLKIPNSPLEYFAFTSTEKMPSFVMGLRFYPHVFVNLNAKNSFSSGVRLGKSSQGLLYLSIPIQYNYRF